MLSDKCGIYLQLPIFIFNYCQFVSFNKFKQGVLLGIKPKVFWSMMSVLSDKKRQLRNY